MSRRSTPVVVLRNNDICALGSVRSMGNAGHDVIVVGFDYPGSPAWSSNESRFCAEFREISNPGAEPIVAAAQLSLTLGDVAERYGESPALIATSDTSLALIDLLGPPNGRAVAMTSALYPAGEFDLNDKVVQGSVLQKSGVATPQFSSWDDLDAMLGDGRLKFPIIAKPRKKGLVQSFYHRHGGLKGIKFSTRTDLDASEEVIEHGPDLIFQTYVEDGLEPEVCAYVSRRDFDGKCLTMSVRKHLVTPSGFGTASVVESVADVNLENLAKRLAEHLRWDGVLMVEFKFDEVDQEWKCLEVNFRPWLLVDFPRRHGLNFLGHWLSGGSDEIPDTRVSRLAAGCSHVSLQYLKSALRERGIPVTLSSIMGVLEAQGGAVSIAEWDAQDGDLSRRHLAKLGLTELIPILEERMTE